MCPVCPEGAGRGAGGRQWPPLLPTDVAGVRCSDTPPTPPRSAAPVTFNALLEACTRHNDEERAGEIMQRMLLAGVRPDDFTLEAVRPRRAMRSLLKRTFDGITF